MINNKKFKLLGHAMSVDYIYCVIEFCIEITLHFGISLRFLFLNVCRTKEALSYSTSVTRVLTAFGGFYVEQQFKGM